MDIYVPCGILLVFLAVDWAITRSSKRRDEWGFWENWNFFVYGPCFVLLCLVMEVDVWLQDWTLSARLPILIGFPVVAVFIAHGWYRYFGARLRALLREDRGNGGSGGDEGPKLPRWRAGQ
jgi:hypothetical protein